MFILYDLIFLIFALIYLPVYLFRRKFHQGFLLRLGILPRGLELNSPIWIHAVSVGEVMAMRGLLETLREIYPDKKFVISTVTSTANLIAKSIARDTDFVTYLPLDFSSIVSAVMKRIKPSLFIVAETEIWPNLITVLFKNKIPVIVVNGRISDDSFKGYLAIKFLLKPILNKIAFVCVQSQLDAQRLIKLGVIKNKIQITGNMKFDVTDYTELKNDYTNYRKMLGLGAGEKLLVAGSTHPGEEEIILAAYKKLLDEFPNLRLLITPRHPERSEEVRKLALKNGFETLFVSNLTPNTYNLKPIFILDTIGQLLNYYCLADIVFVAGSLVKIGGHNILEPASLGKPILFGPHMFNFRDIAELFLKNQAAIKVCNQQELQGKIKYLLKNPKVMDELSSRARLLIVQNQGATLRNSEIIKKVYAGIPLPRYKNPSLWAKFCNGVYNLATDKSKGFIADIIKVFLFLLSLLYGLAVRILILFYRLLPYRLNCKVISIGNITLGGTGKTSLVQYITRYLRQQGRKVAIITRGYKRKLTTYDLRLTTYENMGDEPYMLSKKLAEIPVIVDKDRIRAAKKAIKDYASDTVILDDGFQQWRLKKDLEIVAIDATNPFGNRNILPRGILREPLSSLKRADIFVLTKTNLEPQTKEIEDLLMRLNPQAEIFTAIHQPLGFYDMEKANELLDKEFFKGKTATLFSGIGDPASFENLIKSLGIEVDFHYRFRDHHNYTQGDLDNIIMHSRNKHIDAIITTEKDAVRLYSLLAPLDSKHLTGLATRYSLPIFVLRIELAITKDEQRFYNRLLSLYSF